MTSGTPESNTTAAASGSAHTLNSATGSRLPNVPPPISEMPAMRRCRSGAVRECERDVRERADRHQPRAVVRPAGVDDEADGVRAVDVTRRRRQVGAVETARAVDETGVLRLGDERPFGSGMDLDVEPEQLPHDPGVVRGPFERCVAGNGRDAEQVGVAGSDDDRHRVVVAGVAVEDDRRSWHDGELGTRCATMNRCDRASSSHVGSVSPPRLGSCCPPGSPAAPPVTTIPTVRTTRARRRPRSWSIRPTRREIAVGAPGSDPTAATSESLATIPAVGVPGLDSDEVVCRAWSRFAGSFQVVSVAASFGSGDAEDVAGLEVIAAPTVTAAYGDLIANWPAELAEEADAVADGYLGPFARRADRALAALQSAGADATTIDTIVAAWETALAGRDPSEPEIVVELPDTVQAIVDAAASRARGTARADPVRPEPRHRRRRAVDRPVPRRQLSRSRNARRCRRLRCIDAQRRLMRRAGVPPGRASPPGRPTHRRRRLLRCRRRPTAPTPAGRRRAGSC